MDNQTGQKYTTSFIPKKPVVVPNAGYSKTPSSSSVFALIGLLIFFVSIAAASGVYVWEKQVKNTIEKQFASLDKTRQEFDDSTISAATRLNDRIIALNELLENHKSPSEALALLEETVLTTVGFKSLTYSTEASGAIRLRAVGVAKGFSSIILQSREMGDTGKLRDVVFTDTQPAEGGFVSFALNSLLEEKVVLYKNKFKTQLSSEDKTVEEPPVGDTIFSRQIFK